MIMEITYHTDRSPSVQQVTELYNSSGINRPTGDTARIGKMYEHSNLVVTAWHNDQLVGVARSLTDHCYCCYLSDLAVSEAYKHQGIGKQLIALTKQTIGPQCMLLLLAAPAAMDYYPKVGFEKVENGYIIKREQ